jgi:hypothetical protein
MDLQIQNFDIRRGFLLLTFKIIIFINVWTEKRLERLFFWQLFPL